MLIYPSGTLSPDSAVWRMGGGGVQCTSGPLTPGCSHSAPGCSALAGLGPK
jgi:hypothetical protein